MKCLNQIVNTWWFERPTGNEHSFSRLLWLSFSTDYYYVCKASGQCRAKKQNIKILHCVNCATDEWWLLWNLINTMFYSIQMAFIIQCSLFITFPPFTLLPLLLLFSITFYCVIFIKHLPALYYLSEQHTHTWLGIERALHAIPKR